MSTDETQIRTVARQDTSPGNINTVQFQVRYDLGEVKKQKSLATAHVQDLIAGLYAVMLDHGAGDFLPATLHVAIATVANFPISVPVVKGPFFGQGCGPGFWEVGIIDPGQVVALGTVVNRGH